MSNATRKNKKQKQSTMIHNGNGGNIFKCVFLDNQVNMYRLRSSQAVPLHGKETLSRRNNGCKGPEVETARP